MSGSATNTNRLWSRGLSVAVVVVGLACLARAFRFVDRYATNVLYSDQWDLLNPLFEGRSIVGWFTYQHGPHRQGVGGVWMAIVGGWTSFNGRAEAMLCLAGLAIATAGALALRYRLNGRFGWIDVVWPAVFLSARQGHHLAVVPNNAHSATPLALVMALALLLTVKAVWWRNALLVVLGFFTTFTGFGIFVAPLVPLVFAIEALAARRAGNRAAARTAITFGVVSAAMNMTFVIGYRPETSNPTFGVGTVTAYVRFLADLFSLAVAADASPVARWIGGLLLVLMVVVCCGTGRRLLARSGEPAERRARVVFFLSAFTLLFAVFCAIGRATMDERAGGASRYFALLIPGLIALSLAIERLPRQGWRVLASGLLTVALLVGHAVPRADELQSQSDYRDLKDWWRYEFLRTGDVGQTYERFVFDIYTAPPTDYEMLNRKARFLREHGLSFYRPD